MKWVTRHAGAKSKAFQNKDKKAEGESRESIKKEGRFEVTEERIVTKNKTRDIQVKYLRNTVLMGQSVISSPSGSKFIAG